jgi:ribosomal protein S27E
MTPIRPAPGHPAARTSPAACPHCQSPDIAVIGRDGQALICDRCGGAWALSPANPAYLRQIDGGHPFSRGECAACGRVLARTRTGNGVLIVHGPRQARCPGSGQRPKFPARRQDAE